MSDAQHTPGPWTIEQGQFAGGMATFVQPVCVILGHGECPTANARLIKAAPNLLAALEAAQSHLEFCGWGDRWERECAREEKLPELIQAALDEAVQS